MVGIPRTTGAYRRAGKRPSWLAFVGLALIIAVVVALIVVWARGPGTSTRPAAMAPDFRASLAPAPAAGAGTIDAGYRSRSLESEAAGPFVAAIRSDGLVSTVAVLTADTRSLVGTFDVQADPFVVVRPTRNQILISDQYLKDGSQSHARLMIFGASGSLELQSIIALPKRLSYTAFARGMEIAEDGRYLYYAGLEQLTTPECKPNADSAICDLISVGVVDLDGPILVGRVDLEVGCGAPVFAPVAGSSSMIATCSATGRMYEVTSTASAADIGGGAASGVYERPGVLGRPAFAGRAAGGERFVVFDSGLGWVGSPDRLYKLGLANTEHLSNLSAAPLVGGSVALGIFEGSDPTLTGLLVWNPNMPDEPRRYEVPPGASSFTPSGDGGIVVGASGQLFVIGLADGRISSGAVLPQDFGDLAR